MNAREVQARLKREGYEPVQGKGSHVKWEKAGHKTVVVPNHRGDILKGLLRAICKDAGWEWPPGR
jgi:predicted RNA binding protein YcfA (HicA-like mRNA interferase family)